MSTITGIVLYATKRTTMAGNFPLIGLVGYTLSPLLFQRNVCGSAATVLLIFFPNRSVPTIFKCTSISRDSWAEMWANHPGIVSTHPRTGWVLLEPLVFPEAQKCSCESQMRLQQMFAITACLKKLPIHWENTLVVVNTKCCLR
jgi:hypothetical protein